MRQHSLFSGIEMLPTLLHEDQFQQEDIVTQSHLGTNASIIIQQCTIIHTGKSHSLSFCKLVTSIHQSCQVHIDLEGNLMKLALIDALLLDSLHKCLCLHINVDDVAM